jgi:protein ImuB
MSNQRTLVGSERASEPRERSAPTPRRARERVGESEGRSPSDQTRVPSPAYACLYQPRPDDARVALAAIAQEFSPRYEVTRADRVIIDVSGLDRLLGPPAVIGAELAREAEARGVRAHVAIAATHTAAAAVARWRPGVTVVERGREAAALAPIPIGILEHLVEPPHRPHTPNHHPNIASASAAIAAMKHWGVRTLGELAALPAAELVARFGRTAEVWHAIARGEDRRPLMPARPEERFDATLELEWPIDGLEPLSFVLTRLLEPLSTRLERRDRGAAVLHVLLRIVGDADAHARRLELPTPMREVRTLRTLALLDLESHPPSGPIEAVTVVIDPTPGRVVQHTLFERAHPTPEQLSTLLARLGALIGQDRIGAAAVVDSYRPGAFAMKPFPPIKPLDPQPPAPSPQPPVTSPQPPATGLSSALRRYRHPVPARVATERDRPSRVTTDRRGFAGGSVTHAAGPWRTSGNWWASGQAGRAGLVGQAGRAGEAGQAGQAGQAEQAAVRPRPPGVPCPPRLPCLPWNRDEWDVALSDGAVYRIFRDRDTGQWFIDGIVD